MRFYSYLNSAKTILGEYDGSIPFTALLKQHFKSHKKFGSRDRKIVSDICYSYFRLGKLFNEKSVEDRLIIAQFLCHDDSELIKELKPEWAGQLSNSLDEKLNFLSADRKLIFPFAEELSNEIEKEEFVKSHLIQPDLFLRVRPNKQQTVIQKLEQPAVSFSIEGDCTAIEHYSYGMKNGKCIYFTNAGEPLREESWRAFDTKSPYDTIDIRDIEDPSKIVRKQIIKVEPKSYKHGTWVYYNTLQGTIESTEQWVMNRPKEEVDAEAVAAEDDLAPIDPAGKKTTVKKEDKKATKPAAVLEYEKKNSGKKKIKMRDGSTGG